MIRDILSKQKAFHDAGQVGLFCGREWEVALSPLWQLRPDSCVFPKAKPEDRTMTFFRVERLDELQAGYAGILEPAADPGRAVAAWKSTDLILVPGYLFDARGGRIGSGHGYYDRFLASVPAQRWGVCFSHQISKEGLAQEPTDVRMDAVCSELGLRPCDP